MTRRGGYSNNNSLDLYALKNSLYEKAISSSTCNNKNNHHFPPNARRGCGCTVQPSVRREFMSKWSFLTKDEVSSVLSPESDAFYRTCSQLLSCMDCRELCLNLFRQSTCDNDEDDEVMYPSLLRHGALEFTPSGFRFRWKEHCKNMTEDEVKDRMLQYFVHWEEWGDVELKKPNHGRKTTSSIISSSSSSNNTRIVSSTCALHRRISQMGNKNGLLTTGSGKYKQLPRLEVLEECWEFLEEEQQQQVVSLDVEEFFTELETYLRRHRFCCRCKEKVLEAYDVLIGSSSTNNVGGCDDEECEDCNPRHSVNGACCNDDDTIDDDNNSNSTTPYTSFLFDELTFCQSTGMILVPCHLDYMSHIMSRLDDQLDEEWGQDRHARSMAEAQDEILTCMGTVIWNRMLRIWNDALCAKRAEELVVYVSMTTLRDNINNTVERLHGEEIMEQLLAEEDDESRRLAKKKEKRKEKRKKRKNAKVKSSTSSTTTTQPAVKEEVLPQLLPQESTSTAAVNSVGEKKSMLDEDAERQLLSSMGWCESNDDIMSSSSSVPPLASSTTTDDILFYADDNVIPEDDLTYWKENQSKLVSQRLETRRRLKDQFNHFVLKNKI